MKRIKLDIHSLAFFVYPWLVLSLIFSEPHKLSLLIGLVGVGGCLVLKWISFIKPRWSYLFSRHPGIFIESFLLIALSLSTGYVWNLWTLLPFLGFFARKSMIQADKERKKTLGPVYDVYAEQTSAFFPQLIPSTNPAFSFDAFYPSVLLTFPFRILLSLLVVFFSILFLKMSL